MKRPTPADPAAPGGVTAFPDETWMKGLPLICEYLACDAWDDGKPREVSTVSIKMQEGRVLLILNDVDLRRSLYVTADGVMLGLKALEKQLGSSVADWRVWKGAKGKRG